MAKYSVLFLSGLLLLAAIVFFVSAFSVASRQANTSVGYAFEGGFLIIAAGLFLRGFRR